MKKVLLTMVVMLGLGCFSAFAAETSANLIAVESVSSLQDESTKIEVADIPAEVKTGVEKAYPNQTIKEASVAEKDGAKTYKLVLTSAEGTESTVTFDAKGEEVK